MPIKIKYLLFVTLVLTTSCFHKSDKTGTADDIENALTCHTPKGDFLVTHDEVFHATSKSTGTRGTFISGYEHFRYTVYDLKTGAQVTRLVLGKMEEDMKPLYFDGKQIWFYGADKKMGLHARDAATLNTSVQQEEIEKRNPAIANQLATPKINEAAQFYSYDPLSNQIVVTDVQGNLFGIDPATLLANPLTKKTSFSAFFNQPNSDRAYRGLNDFFSLSGGSRKLINMGDKKSKESFLNAKILLEQDVRHLSALSLLLKKGDPKDSVIRNVQMFQDLSQMILGCDSNTIYIMHANNLSDTSSLLISELKFIKNEFALQWTTLVPQIYFDTQKGIKKDPMSDVFKAGDPQFRFEWYGLEDNILVGIKMLFAFAIDVQTGKLLWKQQL